MKTIIGLLFSFLLLAGVPAIAQPAKTAKKAAPAKPVASKAKPTSIRGVPVIHRAPYLGMIAIDGETGKVLLEDSADVTVYPASVIKLMTLFIVEDRIQQGSLRLADQVTVTAEMAKVGASQVWLAEKESFSVEELLYALMVKSANDAAMALAIQVAGSQPAFVELMNQKAQALGMTHTRFYTCHGLPPSPPQKPAEVDISTPRDLALLGRALVNCHSNILQYTSTMKRVFRPGPKKVDMLNHNHRLMSTYPGMDGLKTGYFEAAGYSSLVTAKRNNRRVFVVVACSGKEIDYGKMRDKAAVEILNRAFAALPPLSPAPPPSAAMTNRAPVTAVQPDPTSFTPAPPEKKAGSSNWRTLALVLGVAVAGAVVVAAFLSWRRRRSDGLNMDDVLKPSRRPPLPPLRR